MKPTFGTPGQIMNPLKQLHKNQLASNSMASYLSGARVFNDQTTAATTGFTGFGMSIDLFFL